MPHLRVEETPESRRGETWTGAGGNEIKKEGKVTVNWQIDVGHHEARCIQSRTSVKNIDQCGQTSGNRSWCDPHEEQAAHCQHENGRDHVTEESRMHVLSMDVWIWVPTIRSKAES